MTDQEAFQYAGWIERARKAEAALTRYGYVIFTNGEWVLSDAAIARLVQRPAPPAKPNGYVYPKGLPVHLPARR